MSRRRMPRQGWAKITLGVSLLFAIGTFVYRWLAEADRPVEHKPVAEIRDATVEQGYEERIRNTGSWPFDGIEG